MKIFVDMDGVLCDYEAAWHKENVVDWYPYFPQSRVGFFRELEPITGAIEGIKRLAQEYEVYILTAPSVKNNHCWSEKAWWIEHYLGPEWLERLIITKNKGLLHQPSHYSDEIHRTYLIDDQNFGGGREVFWQYGDMYWFQGKDACWNKVVDFFYA